jgi:hypothetical protein
MDDQYANLHKQAVDLQYKFHDFTAGINHPDVQLLQNEIRHLTDEIGARKNPHTIEDRIKTIQRQLIQSEHSGSPIMHYERKDYLNANYDHMRQSLRGFQHY